MSIASNLDFLNRLPKMNEGLGGAVESPLQRIDDFGANPGNLAMWSYVPANLPPNSPLVVVLHGCTQTARAFDHGSGWTALAARYGFAVLVPEQQRTNNPNLCFNWFDPDKTMRGAGEALSIHRMIATMVRLHQVSAKRIFIVGLSAGGAMASSMLAAYPDVFAAGAIIAGLPHGVASNLREALAAMATAPARRDAQLGDLVRNASSHQGRWPRVSVWHGNADRVVHPANADQIVAQWRNVHGLPSVPTQESQVDGHRRAVWSDAEGQPIVERYDIDGMGHGVPLALAGQNTYGAAGPFMLDAGISSTLRIAAFFGLVQNVPQTQDALDVQNVQAIPKSRQPFDVANVINRALTAAGLMK